MVGLSNFYQQVCVLVRQGGGVLLECCFSVVEVAQMSEWGWVVYDIMFSVGCSGGLKVVGGLAFLFLFLRGGKANISGSLGPKSVSGGFLSKGDGGVSSIHLDSASKQMSASKYGWRGLVRFSVWYSGVTEGDSSGGVFKFSSTESSSGSTVGESG